MLQRAGQFEMSWEEINGAKWRWVHDLAIPIGIFNHIHIFTFLYSKACKESPVSSTFVMLSSILDDLKECRQSSARMRDIFKYKEKDVFTVNEGRKYKLEG